MHWVVCARKRALSCDMDTMLSAAKWKAGRLRQAWLVSCTLLAANSALISCTRLSRLMLGNLRAACRMCRYSCGRLSSLMPHQDTWTSLLRLVLAVLGLLIAQLPRLQFCKSERRSLVTIDCGVYRKASRVIPTRMEVWWLTSLASTPVPVVVCQALLCGKATPMGTQH